MSSAVTDNYPWGLTAETTIFQSCSVVSQKYKKYGPPFPHLLQAQQALALLHAKVAGRPGTGSYPAPLPSPTTQRSVLTGPVVNRGGYRFTVYIENQYFRTDICIESNMSVSKKISITNVNGQTLYISTENPLANSEIVIILD